MRIPIWNEGYDPKQVKNNVLEERLKMGMKSGDEFILNKIHQKIVEVL